MCYLYATLIDIKVTPRDLAVLFVQRSVLTSLLDQWGSAEAVRGAQ